MGLKFLPKQIHSGIARVVGVAVKQSVLAVGFAVEHSVLAVGFAVELTAHAVGFVVERTAHAVGFAVERTAHVGFAVARSLADSCAAAYEG
jgi:hypothetical protein